MNPPHGFSLLLSLFVLSAILMAALSAGNLVVRELRLTTSFDQGVLAFYAAESGLEDALYDFRQKNSPNLNVVETSAITLGNGRWWRVSNTTLTEFSTTLLENEVAEVTLFNTSGSAQAWSVRVSWTGNPTMCPGSDFTWIEVLQSYWVAGESQSQRSLLSPSDNDTDGVTVNLSGSYPYVRLRALFGDACNLTLRAYAGLNATGASFNLPAQLEVTAYGAAGEARQALSITVPAHAPQFGAFDYTLFSEEAICKDVSPCN
ncbi:MAG: hypothetical protein U1C53_02875 [Candidatus Veblenbacteria bacterium]|nr:hypothetical protein [Candidatus Veblenbacteria bacterium]MDZ4230058.1 hypothetical protein [Candidatus Veblenbacteria bacterium]